MIKKFNNLLLCTFVLFTFFIIPTKYQAKTLGDLKAELKKKQNEYNESVSNKNNVNNNIQVSKSQISDNHNAIKKAEDDLVSTGEKIQKLDGDIRQKNIELDNLMKLVQVTDADNGYLEYIFGAKDMTDFLRRMSITEELATHNEKKIDELNKMIKDSQNLQVELKQKQNNLQTQIDSLETKINTYNVELGNLSDIIFDVNSEIKALNASIKYYQDKGCKDNQSLDACLRNNLPYDTAFWRPLEFGYVTSEYGYRWHPTSGSYSKHQGVDLGARNPKTSANEVINVYAAASGKVSVVNDYNNNSCGGNYIIIHHNVKGKEYTTAYLHLKSVKVKVGQYVTKDTAIGIMGGNNSSSWAPGYTPWDRCSTGQHLHFQISNGLQLSIGSMNYRTFNARTLVNIPKGLYKYWYNRTTRY